MSSSFIGNFLATVLLIHTSQFTRFIKRRTQPTCFEYIYTIVGKRLDELSYWDSCKLIGRPWNQGRNLLIFWGVQN